MLQVHLTQNWRKFPKESGLFSCLFCYWKTLTKTQSLIEFQNSVLINKHFQRKKNTCCKYSVVLYLIQLSQPLYIPQLFNLRWIECLFYTLLFCFTFTFFEHSKHVNITIKAYTKILGNKLAHFRMHTHIIAKA